MTSSGLPTIRVHFHPYWRSPEQTPIHRILAGRYGVLATDVPEADLVVHPGPRHGSPDAVGLRLLFTGEALIPEMADWDYAIGLVAPRRPTARFVRCPGYLWPFTHTTDLVRHRHALRERTGRHPHTASFAGGKRWFCGFAAAHAAAERDTLFTALARYKPLVSAGPHRNNANFHCELGSMPARDHPRWQDIKIAFARHCKFMLVAENTGRSGYVTEKIMHAFLGHAVPIYWGCPNIKEEFNEAAFVNAEDFDCTSDLIERIREIDSDDGIYRQMLAQPVLSERNPLRRLFERTPDGVDLEVEHLREFVLRVAEVAKAGRS